MRRLDEFGLNSIPSLHETCMEHGVRFAYLFGSRAEGEARATSDADIACYFGRGDATDRFYRAARLQREIQKTQSVEIEVVALNEAGPVLRFEAMRPGVVIMCDDDEFRIAQEMAWSREYDDYQYRQHRYMRWRAEELEEARKCSTHR